MQYKSFLFTACLLVPLLVGAQRMSLADYKVQVALNDEILLMSDEGRAIATANRKATKTVLLPRLDFEGKYNLDFNSLSNTSGYNPHNYGANVVLSQNVFSGGAAESQYRIAKKQEEQSGNDYEMTLDAVMYQAELYYWSASANREFLLATKEFQSIVNNLYAVIQARYTDGLLAKTDLMMVMTRVKEAEGAVIQANQSYMVSHQRFNNLMGLPSSAPQQQELDPVVAELERIAPVDIEAVNEGRPDFRSAIVDIDIQREMEKSSLAKVNPQIAVGAQAGYGTPFINVNGKGQLNGAAFVSVKIPIFHWNERGAIRTSSRAAILTKELNLQKVRHDIELEVANALTAMQESERLISTVTENMSIASENLDLTTFSYTEGKLPILDVLSAQMSWIQAQNNLISAHMNYRVAVADYKKAISAF